MKKIILSFILAWHGAALAADDTVYVDFERIYRQSQVVSALQDKLNSEFRPREEALEAQRAEFVAARDELRKEEITLSAQERETRTAALVKMERDFVRDRQALVEDRNIRFQERRRAIDLEVARLVSELAGEKGYTVVLNPFFSLPLAAGRVLNHSIIVYADPAADITDEVIRLFDEKANLDS